LLLQLCCCCGCPALLCLFARSLLWVNHLQQATAHRWCLVWAAAAASRRTLNANTVCGLCTVQPLLASQSRWAVRCRKHRWQTPKLFLQMRGRPCATHRHAPSPWPFSQRCRRRQLPTALQARWCLACLIGADDTAHSTTKTSALHTAIPNQSKQC
jgi:hypothetical protein